MLLETEHHLAPEQRPWCLMGRKRQERRKSETTKIEDEMDELVEAQRWHLE